MGYVVWWTVRDIIDEVQDAFKLSQKRHERDYARIIEQFEAEGEVEMAEAMKERL